MGMQGGIIYPSDREEQASTKHGGKLFNFIHGQSADPWQDMSANNLLRIYRNKSQMYCTIIALNSFQSVVA